MLAPAWCGKAARPKAKSAKPKHSALKVYKLGYLHIDLKCLPLRATRWVFISILTGQRPVDDTRRFLRDPERRAVANPGDRDNGKDFADRPSSLRKRAAAGEP